MFGENEILLTKKQIPKKYYNILPDLPSKLPMPKGDMSVMPKIFPKALLEQEFSTKRFVRIPEKVRELYSLVGRPTPLHRAKRLEEFLQTPAKIYFKREDTLVTGSHKLNTALAQAYYIKKEGFTNVATETGAGQWGSALSLASSLFGLKCLVYMVKCSYQQKPYRKHVMNFYGAKVIPSPSKKTEAGKAILKKNPKHPGTLGIAISEAIETALRDDNTVYSLGSVLNHVLMHQTVIGEETIKQLNSVDEFPDTVIGCFGGGSNFSGLAYPLIREAKERNPRTEFIAVEPKEVPSLSRGPYKYDYGDEAGLTPQLKMYTLGHKFAPLPIYAGGLRYHGSAPTTALLKKEGVVKAVSYSQRECFEAARIFAQTEGIIPAPETAHAIKAVIDKALKAKKAKESKTIVFNFSGHGLLDLGGYAKELGFE